MSWLWGLVTGSGGSDASSPTTSRLVLPAAEATAVNARLVAAVVAALDEYETTKAPLTSVDLAVAELCAALEACFEHGLRSGPQSLWALLRRTEACAVRQGSLQPILAATIEAVAQLRHVHTETGRSRAWLRKCLNGGHAGLLQRSFDVLLAEPGLLRASYCDGSYLRESRFRRRWTDSLQQISRVPFDLDVDTAALDAIDDAKRKRSGGVKLALESEDSRAEEALRRRAALPPDSPRSSFAEAVAAGGNRHRGRSTSGSGSSSRRAIQRKTSGSALTTAWLGNLGNVVVNLAQTAAKAVGGGDVMAPSVLGQTLAMSVRDVEACLMAPSDPLLGIPLFPLRAFEMIDAMVRTRRPEELRGMWHGSPPESHLETILAHFQREGTLPAEATPVQLGTIVKLYLHSLTEPLLTFQLFHAFVSAADIADRDARAAHLRELLARIPLEHKPLLSRVVRCVSSVLRLHLPAPGGTIDDEVKRDIGRSLHRLAPAILRLVADAEPGKVRSKSDIALSKRVTAVVKVLVLQQKDIFAELRTELRQREHRLRSKVKRLRRLAMQRHEPIDIEDRGHLSMLRGLWTNLAPDAPEDAVEEVEAGLTVKAEVEPVDERGSDAGSDAGEEEESESTAVATEAAALASVASSPSRRASASSEGLEAANAVRSSFPTDLLSPFWRTRGFQGDDPRIDFGGGGVLALRCLTFFVSRHRESALRLTLALRRRGVPFATAGANVCHTLAELVCLKAEKIGIRPGYEMLDNPFWRLADDGAAFERLFCLVLFMVAVAWGDRDFHPMEFNLVLVETRDRVAHMMAETIAAAARVAADVAAARLAEAQEAGSEGAAALQLAPPLRDEDRANPIDELWMAWLDDSAPEMVERPLLEEALRSPSLAALVARRAGGAVQEDHIQVSAAWRIAAAIGGAVVGVVDRAVTAIGGEDEAGAGAGAGAEGAAADGDETAVSLSSPTSPLPAELAAARKSSHRLLVDVSGILDEANMNAIVELVPEDLRETYEWTLAFSLLEHGASLDTMFRCCQRTSSSILCVRTIDNCVFGAFVTEAWEKQSGYFGSGESFLFTFARELSAAHEDEGNGMRDAMGEEETVRGGDGSGADASASASAEEDAAARMRAYRWTGVRVFFFLHNCFCCLSHDEPHTLTHFHHTHTHAQRNGMFQLADDHAIAVGGGGGFGFYLDAGLLRGSSERCDTFDNACLAETRSFDVANVEIWVPRVAAF